MTGLILTLCTICLGLIAHALLMRRLPRRWILFSVPICLLSMMIVLIISSHFLGYSIPILDSLVALVLVFSLGFGYALTLVGVIHDSPTLSIVNEIESHGADGMPVEAFTGFIERHPFFESRLTALIASGELRVEHDRFILTGHASRLLWIGDLYRHARGGDVSRTG